MIKSNVIIDFPNDIDFSELNIWVEDNCEQLADDVERDAKSTSAFADKTGNLRKSIKKRKSKFEGGGWIVFAKAPHAHLIEFGHDLIRNGFKVGRVPAYPFMGPAKEKIISKAKRLFGAK